MQRLAWTFRFVAVVAAGALLLTGVTMGIGPRLWRIANAHEQVPVELPGFTPLSQRTVVYDVDNKVIAVFEREKTQPISIDDVPDDVIAALLAVEDTEFFSHKGVNVRGFMRALLSNFASDAPTQGASTITQQVVKNEFLAGLPRDGRYKALQAHYAVMLEKRMTKGEILERYLNTVYFGNNAYGLQAAAEVYFGRRVDQLTLVQGAFLAGLVRSPTGYDPIRNPEPSRRRFAQVTTRLAKVGLITEDESERLAEEWEIPYRVRTLSSISTVPTYYTNALRDYLLTRSTLLGVTEQERANLLYRGGLKIHTTLDADVQRQAEAARDILPDNATGIDAAVVTLDTTTGAIRALVGGRGLRPDEPGGEVDMAFVPRQTGSSIKAFILAAAYEAGAEIDDVINGPGPCTVPDFVDGVETTKTVTAAVGEIGPIGRRNTWDSTDCGFIRLSYAIGLHRLVDSVYRYADSTYFNQGQSAEDRTPFLPLPLTATGNNEMSPMDMAAGMQTILNQGLHHEPYFVEWIDAADGSRMYTHEDPGVQALDAPAALKTVESLRGVLTDGTGARNLSDVTYPAAGKTGTQYENTNAWFVGGTPVLTTAVWVGDPDGYTPMVGIPEFEAEMGRGGKVQGADYPARIWESVMNAAMLGLPPSDWPGAPSPARTPARILVPGEECAATLVSGTLPFLPGMSTTSTSTSSTTSTTAAPTTTTTAPVVTVPGSDPGSTVAPPPVSTTPPSTTTSTTISEVAPVSNLTTVPIDVIDPRAPMPSVALDVLVYPCDRLPASVVLVTETT